MTLSSSRFSRTQHAVGSLAALMALSWFLMPLNATASEYGYGQSSKEEREAEKKRLKEVEERAKEEAKEKKKLEEQKRKEEEKVRKEKEKAMKEAKEKGIVQEGPTRTRKTGEAINDYVVDFEDAFDGSAALFEVTELVKHDYDACAKVSEKLEKASRDLVRTHDDRLRQFGNDYHHELELLAINAHRLNVAVSEHHRTEVFTYWNQLKIMRARMAENQPWKAPEEEWKK